MRPVAFIHRGGEGMASYRYRTKIPAEYIGASINESETPAEIVVFSKPVPADVELAKQAKKAGCKIVLDLCDPHLQLPHYKEIYDLADEKVVASDWAREHIVPEAHVIPDPYEFDEQPPHCNGDQFLWFGHKVNLKDVKKFMGAPNLRVISGPFDDVPEGVTFYSPENLKRGLLEADFTLFPTSKGSEYKSANRLINALRMGTFPICDPHPAYDEFKDFVWVGPMGQGFQWTRHYKDELNGLIEVAQDYIRYKYSPENIGETWKSLLESI